MIRDEPLALLPGTDLVFVQGVLPAKDRVQRAGYVHTPEAADHAGVAPHTANDLVRSPLCELVRILRVRQELARHGRDVILALADVSIRFEGFESGTGYALYQQAGDQLNPLNQSVHGNDFWQTDVEPETAPIR